MIVSTRVYVRAPSASPHSTSSSIFFAACQAAASPNSAIQRSARRSGSWSLMVRDGRRHSPRWSRATGCPPLNRTLGIGKVANFRVRFVDAPLHAVQRVTREIAVVIGRYESADDRFSPIDRSYGELLGHNSSPFKHTKANSGLHIVPHHNGVLL